MSTEIGCELRFELNSDYSGCKYTLFINGSPVRSWRIMYGYNTPEWQEQEKIDRATMVSELKDMGLNFDEINKDNKEVK